jgi:hypothetical protein
MQTPAQSTLLNLVHTLGYFTDSDCEVVAIVTYLVNSGRVRLCGNFAGATIEPAPPDPTTPTPSSFKEDAP